ncbi:alpha/beta-hydrolase [Stipitochalara longipes BDJ]|nr:alpha/beta-hydrolase [Stipitochalara longipes BDJ]
MTWVLKALVKVVFGVHRRLKPAPPSQYPTLLKTYSVQPRLTNRVFIPRSHENSNPLPLYIDIHLGGFVMGEPWWDDAFCAHFCNTYNILVVSLNYSKAPFARFPVPVNDIISLVQAVLSDDSLPIDKTRVVIGGFSAGGNLALAAVQALEIRGKIHGVVCWCAITDWVTPIHTKLQNRPYRDAKQVDELKHGAPSFSWAYISPGQDLRDPRLSPIFAERQMLPKWLFFIGAEYDMLCHEEQEMIMDLAGLKGTSREDGKYGFEMGTYRWQMMRGVVHGFTHFIPSESADDRKLRLRRRGEAFAEVGVWLFKGPFA